jgi:hypothetical protein
VLTRLSFCLSFCLSFPIGNGRCYGGIHDFT